jgi:aspartate-semialdehyde dehydrogenase
MLSILEQRRFPVTDLRLMASSRSAGKFVDTPWGSVEIEDLATADPSDIDIVLFSAGGARSLEFAPHFASAGATVVDNSSAFRMDETGQAGISQLGAEIEFFENDENTLISGGWEEPEGDLYARPIAYNVLPLAGSMADAGYTDEEWKLVNETRKILGRDDIKIEPTCVRVPVMVGHGIAANMWFDRRVDLDEAVAVLGDAPGMQLWDDTKVPTPLDSAGIDDVLVGRLRETVGYPGGISLFVVGDNLRKGAALNAVQLAELLLA